MKSALAEAQDGDKKAFVAAVERAIDTEPKQAPEQRHAARNSQHTAFDGVVRESAVESVMCTFPSRVAFD
jgi:hypothetical protein